MGACFADLGVGWTLFVIPAKAGIQKAADAGYEPNNSRERAFVRIRIRRIKGFSGCIRRAFWAGRRLSIFGPARFLVVGKSASQAKRNPENPINPINPDSDKDAQPSHIPVIPA